MKTLLLAAAVASLVPSIAFAEGYGKPGQLEAGGFFGLFSETETYKADSPGATEVETTRTGVLIQPQVGYFVSDGLELIGELNVGTFSEKVEDADPTTSTAIGLGFGGGYFLSLGGLRIGPQAILRVAQTTTKIPGFLGTPDDLDVAQQDVGAQVGGFAKMPIGGGGVLAVGLAVDYSNVTQKIEFGVFEAEPTGNTTNIGARVGYFVFF